jgi:cytochrome c oxidase subunit 1
MNQLKARRKKYYFTKCSNRTLVTAGWTFITPFSSCTKYTGMGAQDILIMSVIFAGVSTTVSFTNLLVTRRTLAMPGMRNRRVLLPFSTIGTLLALRMLAIITPVLGAAMIMMMLDRHWRTTFFEYAYGGDPILSQHLFWFFGHPEVYILIIPTFGFINQIIPHSNTRRVASKHHMI